MRCGESVVDIGRNEDQISVLTENSNPVAILENSLWTHGVKVLVLAQNSQF